MVAQAAPVFADPAGTHTIKLLDLLTNRYHVGLVRESGAESLDIELPASVHLQPGQRVRFVIAGDQPIVARHAMLRGLIMQVSADLPDRQNVRLGLVPEIAFA